MSSSAKTRQFDFDVSRWPALPAARGVFVTGTDTGVGKTLIAGAIARNLRSRGKNVEVFKPAATGCRREREGLLSEDAAFLAACAESRRSLTEIAPLRFSHAAAPNVAAARERRDVDLDAMFDAYRRMTTDAEIVVVEGVGGLLCPISDDLWVIHLARLTGLPVVIVAGALLGTINHTLLTVHAARSAGLNVAGVVINRYLLEPRLGKNAPPPEPKTDEELVMGTNPLQVAARGRVEVLTLVPDEPENSVERVRIGPNTQFAMDQVDWLQITGCQRY